MLLLWPFPPFFEVKMTDKKKYNLGAISKSKAMSHVTDSMSIGIPFDLTFIDKKTHVLHKLTHEVEKQEQRVDADGSVWQRVK